MPNYAPLRLHDLLLPAFAMTAFLACLRDHDVHNKRCTLLRPRYLATSLSLCSPLPRMLCRQRRTYVPYNLKLDQLPGLS